MIKSDLIEFINAYHLGGVGDAVTWHVTATEMKTKFASDDKSLIGFVSKPNKGFPVGEYSIVNTKLLLSALSILGDDIDIKATEVNGRVVSLLFSNGRNKVAFALADPVNIPSVGTPKKELKPDGQVNLDTDTVVKYLRAGSALSDEDATLIVEDETASLIIGNTKNNSNSIDIGIGTVGFINVGGNPVKVPRLTFDGKHMSTILSACKSVTTTEKTLLTRLSLYSEGMLKFSPSTMNGSIDYYLVQKQSV